VEVFHWAKFITQVVQNIPTFSALGSVQGESGVCFYVRQLVSRSVFTKDIHLINLVRFAGVRLAFELFLHWSYWNVTLHHTLHAYRLQLFKLYNYKYIKQSTQVIHISNEKNICIMIKYWPFLRAHTCHEHWRRTGKNTNYKRYCLIHVHNLLATKQNNCLLASAIKD